jgi:methylated-DNA-protein-cysteine methyltransferase related protein
MYSDTENIVRVIKSIPRGKVATYGQVAAFAGNPRGARQVARILHSCTAREDLPWHRVINSKGQISLKPGYGFETQRAMLKKEGVKFSKDNTIDMARFQWSPR